MRSELSTASLRPDLPPVYARVVEVSVDCLPRGSSTKAGRAGALAKADLFHPATPTSELRFGVPTMRQFELLNSHLSRRSFNEGGPSTLNYEVLRVRAARTLAAREKSKSEVTHGPALLIKMPYRCAQRKRDPLLLTFTHARYDSNHKPLMMDKELLLSRRWRHSDLRLPISDRWPCWSQPRAKSRRISSVAGVS
jgi:hypothetical protein